MAWTPRWRFGAGTALACIAAVWIAGCDVRSSQQPAAAPSAPSSAPSSAAAGAVGPTPAATTVGMVIDDNLLTARVKTALLGGADASSLEIKVSTRKGKVQLSGFVDNQAQMDRVVAFVRNIDGVSEVENKMTLKAGSASVGNAIDDGIVTTRVKTALLSDSVVKGLQIAVVTRKGQVQLSGFVDNQAQMDQAVAIVRGVDGVKVVDNKMSVKD